MSTFGPTQIEVEDPSTNGDVSVGVGDTYSINSDVSRRSLTPVVDSYSIIRSQAILTVPPAAVHVASRSYAVFVGGGSQKIQRSIQALVAVKLNSISMNVLQDLRRRLNLVRYMSIITIAIRSHSTYH